jgi:hypothetical protein
MITLAHTFWTEKRARIVKGSDMIIGGECPMLEDICNSSETSERSADGSQWNASSDEAAVIAIDVAFT